MSSNRGYMKPALLVVFLTGLLVATISVVSLKNSVSTFAETTGAEKLASKLKYQGIIVKTSQAKCTKTNNILCYKLFSDDGKNTYWVKTDVQKELSILEANQGARVVVVPKGDPQKYNDQEYLVIKNPKPAPIDSKFTLGLGGGFDYVGNPEVEGSGNGFWHTDLGAKSLAIGVYWTESQPNLADATATPPKFIESFPDGPIANCQNKGYRCTLVIDPGGWPSWMGDLQSVALSPAKLGYLKNYAQKLSSRFGTKVDAYSLLNELDYHGAIPAQDYAKIQKAFYDGINAGNQDARVSLHQFATAGPASKDWIPALIAAEKNVDGGKFFDVMNLHYYESEHSRWAQKDSYSQGGIRGLVTWVNTLMSDTPVGVRPIIISEIGDDRLRDSVSEKTQAMNLFKILPQAFSQTNVEYLQWYNLMNYCGQWTDAKGVIHWDCLGCQFIPPADPGKCHGLLFPQGPPNYVGEPNLRKRPSYYAYKTITKELNGMRFLKLDESNPTQIEGYVFTSPSLTSKKEVLWKRPGSSGTSVLKKYNTSQIRVIGITGTEKLVSGTTGIQLTEEPVIVDFSQEALD